MIRVAVGQIRPRKGDYDENLNRVASVLLRSRDLPRPADLVVFPETITSGYFVEGGVRELAVTAGTLIRDLREVLGSEPDLPNAVVGFYEEHDNRYFNSSAYVSFEQNQARIHHVHRKVFLPTYGVFDEKRFVHPGHDVRAFDTPWGRAAMLICEDVWHSLVPTIAALDGAQVVIVPSASPARDPIPNGEGDRIPRSVERWRALTRAIAAEHSVFVVLAQLVGFEGGKGFPGGSIVMGPDGRELGVAPLFDEALLAADIDFGLVTRVRAEQPLLADLEAELPHLVRNISGDRSPVSWSDAKGAGPELRRPDEAQLPVIGGASAADPLAVDPELLTKWLVEFLRDEVVRRRGYQKAIVALSGGVDSAVSGFLAARALGAENVVGLNLPYRTSSEDSRSHARAVAEAIGIELDTIDISKAVDGYLDQLPAEADPTRRGNVMARQRMIAVFDQSVSHGALPLGTGNKTERLLGYFTWHADDSPPVNPIGDLFKTQVWALAQYLGVPSEIVDKPATADLIVGQTDEEDLGVTYENADHILHWVLSGFGEEELEEMGFDKNDIETVHARLRNTHWKRRMPTVAMVSQTAIGEYYLRPVDY